MAKSEMSISILKPQADNIRNKSKFKQASHLLESLLEYVVRSQQKSINYQKLLNVIFLTSLIVTLITSFVTILFDGLKKIPSKHDKCIYFVVKFVSMFGLPCISGCLREIEKYECRRHFTDIGVLKTGYLAFTMFFITNTLVSFYYGLTKLDINIFVGHVIGFIFSIASILVASQEATKLRFDPCEDNHLYTVISSVSTDKGSIRIVESNVFKITIQNIGSEIWNSDTFILHRHTGKCHKGECAKFNLPQFSLLPNQQIDLIPGTLAYDGDCIRVPNFHCFGLRDRFDQVNTFITDKKGLSCHTTEREGTTSCTCYTERIAELVVTYNKHLWTNVIVS